MDQPTLPSNARERGRGRARERGRQVPTVSTVRAVEFVRQMRGASQPHLLRCEDGDNYVVKFQNNPQHVRILANEMLAGQLANLIGLPVPHFAIIEVPAQLIESNPGMQFKLGLRHECCAAGFQFGSRFPGVPSRTLVVDFLPDRLLRQVKNLAAVFLGAFVFDKWTCNCDGRQLIFYRSADDEKSPYSAALVDHGFCFNDGEWNFPDSPIRNLYPHRLVYEAVRGLHSFEPFLSRIERMKAWEIEACVRGIPNEWCGENPGERERLGERLYERRRWLRQAIIDAKNSSFRPFPNWQ